jgi:hypothetical protein
MLNDEKEKKYQFNKFSKKKIVIKKYGLNLIGKKT